MCKQSSLGQSGEIEQVLGDHASYLLRALGMLAGVIFINPYILFYP